jgi:glycosyltransferase involved in cell wall biosynthesis
MQRRTGVEIPEIELAIMEEACERASVVPLVSVVVPCRNERKHIAMFLDALDRQQEVTGGWEVIVADGASDDGTRTILDDYARRNSKVRVCSNSGLIVSTGLNTAIREARGEIIVRMDVHTEYASNFLVECVSVLKATGADNVGGPTVARGNSFISRAIATASQCSFCMGGGRSHNPDYEGPVDTVFPGCWRRSTLLELGLFDERLVRNQDDELNLRLTRSGGTVWQSPRIECWYSVRPTLSTLFRQYSQYGFWKVAVIQKHRLPASFRHVVPGLFVFANLLLPLFAGSFLLAGGMSAVRDLLIAWATLWTIYLSASIAAAFQVTKGRDWKLFSLLPVVFAVYHFAYGFGFLHGMVHFVLRGKAGAKVPMWLTRLTR